MFSVNPHFFLTPCMSLEIRRETKKKCGLMLFLSRSGVRAGAWLSVCTGTHKCVSNILVLYPVLHYLRSGCRNSGFFISFRNPEIQVRNSRTLGFGARNSGNHRIRIRSSGSYSVRVRNSGTHTIKTRNTGTHTNRSRNSDVQ